MSGQTFVGDADASKVREAMAAVSNDPPATLTNAKELHNKSYKVHKQFVESEAGKYSVLDRLKLYDSLVAWQKFVKALPVQWQESFWHAYIAVEWTATVPFDKGVKDLPGVNFKLPMMRAAGVRYATESEMDSLRKALTRPLSPPPDRLDLEALLRKLGLQKYAPIFAAEEIDTVSCLRLLTEDDFVQMQIPRGPRRKLQDALHRA
ncbi:unnamed protein product [Durusdinium trenchii]